MGRTRRRLSLVAAITLACFALTSTPLLAADVPPPAPAYPSATGAYPPGVAYPPGAYYAPVMRYETHPRYGLLGAGIAVLGTAYLAAVVVGSAWCYDSIGCHGGVRIYGAGEYEYVGGAGWPLFIPLIGPFIQAGYASADWIQSWLVIDGIAQFVGLGLIVAGAVTRVRVPIYGDRFGLAPLMTPSSTGLMAVGRF